MEIVKANNCDLKELKRIGMACFRQSVKVKKNKWLVEWLFLRYFSERKFKQRMQKNTMIYVLKNKENILGFYELEQDGLLASLYVDLNKQNQGYGKIMMEDVYLKARKANLKEIRLDANESAVLFYKKLGFKIAAKNKEILGVVMIPMVKKIDS